MPPFSSIRAYLLLAMLAFFVGACGGSTAPPTTPAVVPPTVFTQITGYVSDTAARPLPDVRVEIVDQSQIVASTLSDANGRVAFSGSFAGPVTGRATKEGYVTASQSVQSQNDPFPSTGYVFFNLEPLAAPAKIETGDYSLTVIADSACTDLPDDVRTRTYAATVRSKPPSYFVSVARTTSWCCLGNGGFELGVAGSYIGITDDTSPEMTEQISPSRYLEINAWGGTSVEAPTASTLSFSGDLNYCALQSDTGKGSCSSCGSRIILTRR